jgi:hypothetical protein
MMPERSAQNTQKRPVHFLKNFRFRQTFSLRDSWILHGNSEAASASSIQALQTTACFHKVMTEIVQRKIWNMPDR